MPRTGDSERTLGVGSLGDINMVPTGPQIVQTAPSSEEPLPRVVQPTSVGRQARTRSPTPVDGPFWMTTTIQRRSQLRAGGRPSRVLLMTDLDIDYFGFQARARSWGQEVCTSMERDIGPHGIRGTPDPAVLTGTSVGNTAWPSLEWWHSPQVSSKDMATIPGGVFVASAGACAGSVGTYTLQTLSWSSGSRT